MSPRDQYSSHGTGTGQLLFPLSLRERLELSDREAEVASLVARGAGRADVAERLRIAPSTAAKHLASLRGKLGVATTAQAALQLSRLLASQAATPDEAAAAPASPASTHLAIVGGLLRDDDQRFAARLASAPSLDRMLALMLESLHPLSVRALFYAFLPLGPQSFRSGGAIERQAAPDDAVDVHRALGGVAGNPFARRLLTDPDAVVQVDAAQVCDSGDEAERSAAASMLRFGFRRATLLGYPFGAGYAGMAALCPPDEAGTDPDLATRRANALRRGLLLLQNAAFSFGALAATVDLTVRERDALACIARGCSTAEAADSLRISTRALQKLLRSARQKLGARTSAEAVCLAMALNALVFD